METLVVVAQHRNQYYSSGGKGISPARFNSSPSGGFRDISCRTFESGAGLLPSPFKAHRTLISSPDFSSPKPRTPCAKLVGKSKIDDEKPLKMPVKSSPIVMNLKGSGKKETLISSLDFSSPKPQTPCAKIVGRSKIDDEKPLKMPVKSSPIAINSKGNGKKERPSRDNLCFSELWAGPAYSNSPPPSSLPIPKFSLNPKRTVSLELPMLESEFNLQPMAKSAPASPTREPSSPSIGFLGNDDSATKTLRRILNLDIADD